METVIDIKNLSKKYRINHKRARYQTVRDILGFALINPFGFLKNRAKKLLNADRKEEFWALDNVNIEVKRGEVVGIIGKNGAGKSTLLKILTGITPPTTGEVKLKGKVASLLEVGTGFHPELTGRENIFLNGAILGMTRKEIIKKFDEIVEFSGIEKFIDTPVKRYSSGMYVRLAFSVAAHLESDILLVDEVLAVGDAEFQKKCLGKMDEVTSTGRTILFVSHNMDAVSRLCKRTVLLAEGKVVAAGETNEVIGKYLVEKKEGGGIAQLPLTDADVTLNAFSVVQDGKSDESMQGDKPIEVLVDFTVGKKLTAFRAGFLMKNSLGSVINRSYVQDWAPELEDIEPGRYSTKLVIPPRLLLAGQYQIELKVFCLGIREFFAKAPLDCTILVHAPKDYNELRSKNTDRIGFFLIPNAWAINKTKSS